MRYRLRTLLILLALLPPLLWGTFWLWQWSLGRPPEGLIVEEWLETDQGKVRLYPPVKRSRRSRLMFRFTIRDVLWLTVVVALGVAWWVDHAKGRAMATKQANELAGAKEKAVFLSAIVNELVAHIEEEGDTISIDTEHYKHSVSPRTPAKGVP